VIVSYREIERKSLKTKAICDGQLGTKHESLSMYPLRFQPLLKQYLWGGRRLGEVLNKPIGDDDDYAESWEVVDHESGQSVVANGELAGKTLSELVNEHGKALLGRHHPLSKFPLLFKFLDANAQLSVQVHPDDVGGAKLDPPDLGKTEAWVVMSSEPGSYLYAGLKRGFDRAALEREVARQTTELCLHKVHPQAGDCIFIPAGTVHAIGPGLVVAEIQQASNTTFRLYDWNRVGKDGKTRDLHIEQGLDAIDYDLGPVDPQRPKDMGNGCERLVECDKFILNRWRLSDAKNLGVKDAFQIVAVLEGAITIEGLDGSVPMGKTVLVPADCSPVGVAPVGTSATILQMYLP